MSAARKSWSDPPASSSAGCSCRGPAPEAGVPRAVAPCASPERRGHRGASEGERWGTQGRSAFSRAASPSSREVIRGHNRPPVLAGWRTQPAAGPHMHEPRALSSPARKASPTLRM